MIRVFNVAHAVSINGYTNSIVTLGAHDVGTLTTTEIQTLIPIINPNPG